VAASTPQFTSRDGIIRHGFGLKAEIAGDLAADYHSGIVEQVRDHGNVWQAGQLRLRLAAAFGFCYGVDKAIDFAYETRRRFPERRIFLTNEIIHNPRVNNRLLEMGIRILAGQYANGASIEQIEPEDVVLLPAFGVDHGLLERLRTIGCVLVDTTCGSVVHVWKRVERYARDGYTAIIHGKWSHEETIATCSHVTKFEGGRYLVVRDREEAAAVCEFIRDGQAAAALAARFREASSQGFDFERHLERVGVANQTTMLSSESLEIAGMVRQAMVERYGEGAIDEHFRSFDTICGATQERQDAVLEMMKQPPDLMLVVGGFNSSNTTHLCEIAAQYCPTYHLDDMECLVSPQAIRHQPHRGQPPRIDEGWLPTRRPLEIGLTAGASTPNRVIGEVIERLVAWEEAGAAGKT
jgi:4-hydroxy-3-methylbut-2-enyl diphosphate reductase